jgi:hypothetical protein
MKLKLNLRDLDLADRFQVSRTYSITNVTQTITTALHEILHDAIMTVGMPSQAKCRTINPCFNDFSCTRAVMDCTEITVDIPTEMNKQSSCYSSYKSRHTAKVLTCVAPNGTLTHCSSAYPGSTSDVAIVKHSNVMQQFEKGDLILADKGFTIHSVVPQGVHLNIPPFLVGKSQFTHEEASMCRKIGRARIHVEKANERLKNFAILDHIPHNYRSFATKIIQLCCTLVNLQPSLLHEVTDNYKM